MISSLDIAGQMLMRGGRLDADLLAHTSKETPEESREVLYIEIVRGAQDPEWVEMSIVAPKLRIKLCTATTLSWALDYAQRLFHLDIEDWELILPHLFTGHLATVIEELVSVALEPLLSEA